MSQARFQKQQRDKARKEKAAAKSARKEQRKRDAVEETAPVADAGAESIVLGELAALHERFANDELSFEEFTEAKQEITDRLTIR